MTTIVPAMLRRLSRLSVALLVASLAAGLVLPVYTDEIGWRFQERAGFDGVDKLYSDSCGPGSIVRPPLFMMPARWYSAFFNGAFPDPLFIRLSGILYAGVWVGMLVSLVRRVAPAAQRDALTIVAAGLMGLGVMPLLLIWSRPEQPILLALTGALLIAFGDGRANRPAAGGSGDWTRVAAVLACALIALSYHFKALLLMPAFAACLWLAARPGGMVPRLTALALLCGAAIAGGRYWFGRFDCSADPVLAGRHAAQSLGLRLVAHPRDLVHAARVILGNLDLAAYAKLAAPAEVPMSQWVPPGLVDHAMQKVWQKALVLAWAAALLLGLRGVVVMSVRGITARRLDSRLVMAMLLFAAAAAWSASQIIRNVYETSFVLPVLMLAILFAAAGERDDSRNGALTLLALALALALPVSVGLVAALYGPALARTAAAGGYVEAQPHSLAVFGYARERPRILAAARQCDLLPARRPGNLLVDELTYLPFMASPRPQHWLGVLSRESRGAIGDPIAYLRSRGSAGMILGCRYLPPDLRPRARRMGDYCCMSLLPARG